MSTKRHAVRRPSRRRRRLLRLRSLLVAVPALAAGLLAVSLVGAALSPGNQDFEAKWADWLRANHAGLLAQKFEEILLLGDGTGQGRPPEGPQPRARCGNFGGRCHHDGLGGDHGPRGDDGRAG